ncbi:NAD(P)-dependent oxidoreductase [Sulfitobacter sp. S190]|uniref:NAD(P)-dependent oxidoreductase n=1 Tax=Sulfitobacter sp. S190 TaxID=2867022 RepID=UPI0021A50982|nr:NAD(P)-binding domain-containing protein [Sulfitobacter sp. S190]UWR23391.1 NAD-binding protein [Sulfitobacter sp. S190]
MKCRIGVAGCGRMGAPMLAALRRAGLPARGYDIRPLEPVYITDDIASFAEDLDTLITVVRDGNETDAVLFDQQNFTAIPGLKRIIISSTLSPRYVLGLRARVPSHITLIDAPMSGAQVAAERGTLSFMLGGDRAELDAVQPFLSAMGAHFHRMGPYGAGMQAKVLNNMLAASHTAMTRLVLDWADAAGLDERKLLDLIETSSGQNWLASGFDTIEFARDGHAADNSIGILVKDLASALDAAPDGADTALPDLLRAQIAKLTPRPR